MVKIIVMGLYKHYVRVFQKVVLCVFLNEKISELNSIPNEKESLGIWGPGIYI